MMSTNRQFQKLFSNFLHAVQDVGKSLEVASHLRSNKTSESMFKYFWGLEEAHRCLDFDIVVSSKSKKQSDHLRTEGNIYYQRGQFDQALELYNMCILLAPAPLKNTNIKETTIQSQDRDIHEKQKYASLAYGFANRSAVLFEFEQYEQSITDIDFAIKYGYPKDQIFRIIERKAKCLLELEKIHDAISLVNSTITFLSTLNMDESKKIPKRNRLVSLLNNIQDGQTNSEHYKENIPNGLNPLVNLMNMKRDNVDTSDRKMYPTPGNSLPRLASHHSTILSVSSALKLQYTIEQGRFFVADRDIKPGELILVEKSPFSCLHLNKGILCSHCCVCLRKCNNPLPCHICTMVMFCSETCQSKSTNGHTDVECQTLPTLDLLCVGNYCPLAFKVIAQIPYMKLKSLIPASKMQLAESSPNLNGFNRNGMFDSSDFLSTYAMINNLSRRNGDDLLKKVALSFILTKLLIKSNCYFVDYAGLPFHPTDEDIILLGSTFVTLLMSFHCNAHSVEELQTMNKDTRSIRGIGAAVFPASSLLNHSCNPGTVRSTIGSLMTSYAIRFIPKGAEVTDSYGCHYAVHDTEYRQAELKKKYYFECKCEACIGEWAISEKQSSEPKFKSLNYININEQIKREEDYEGKYKQLKSNFQIAYFNIIKGYTNEENKQIVINFIEFLDRYIVLPCKMYHKAQELLKFCIDKESSSIHTCR